MNKVQIANILLTRRCNLRCDYCSIVQDYDGQPEVYPPISHYTHSELKPEQWINIFSKLKANNPNVFLILYGGEPFLYNGLDQLITYCKRENIHYTVISNNTKPIQPKILELVEKVGVLDGFTASIDPTLAKYKDQIEQQETVPDEVMKTLEGYRNLKKLKTQGLAKDVVAEITVTSENIQYLYETVKILSEAGIYSSITTIDLRKNAFYDFSTVTDKSLLVQREQATLDEFYKIIDSEGLLVHISSLLLKLYEILPCDMKCNIHEDVHNVTIDSDGSFRLCLRIKGGYTPSIKLDNIFNQDGSIVPFFQTALKADYDVHCKGCNHTCLLMSKYFSEGIIDH